MSTKDKTPLTGAEIIWATLKGEDVSGFRSPRRKLLPRRRYDALRGFSIRHILVRHGAECGTHGLWLRTGRPAVSAIAIATSGPGATYMVTGIATAMLDSIPPGRITGQVGSKVRAPTRSRKWTSPASRSRRPSTTMSSQLGPKI